MPRRRPAPVALAPLGPTTTELLRAAEAVEGYDARWVLLHPIMDAQQNADESEYGPEEREEGGTVRPSAWEAKASASLETLLSDRSTPAAVVDWFTARGFRW